VRRIGEKGVNVAECGVLEACHEAFKFWPERDILQSDRHDSIKPVCAKAQTLQVWTLSGCLQECRDSFSGMMPHPPTLSTPSVIMTRRLPSRSIIGLGVLHPRTSFVNAATDRVDRMPSASRSIDSETAPESFNCLRSWLLLLFRIVMWLHNSPVPIIMSFQGRQTSASCMSEFGSCENS